jgi:type I restriction enzyme S subunit
VLIATLGDPIVRACLQPPWLKTALQKADCLRLRCDPDRVAPEYIVQFLNSDALQSQAKGLAHGQTRPRVNLGQLGAVRVPLPPLAEQRRIADILDHADALRAKRCLAIAQLDTLTQSIFLDTFGDPVVNPKGWERVSLGDLLTDIDSGHSPVCLNRPVSDTEWGVLKLGAVTSCRYDPSQNKALPPESGPRAALEVQTGDVLFTRKNTYELVGACALVRETPPRLLLPDLIFRLRLRRDAAVHTSYLHQLLIYPTKRREIQRMAGGSAGSMPNISKARLRSASIERPPCELQDQFAQRVTAVEEMRAVHQTSLAHANALAASLQSRAFRGEL